MSASPVRPHFVPVRGDEPFCECVPSVPPLRGRDALEDVQDEHASRSASQEKRTHSTDQDRPA